VGAIVRDAQHRLGDVIRQSGAVISVLKDDAWPIALGHPGWVEEVWVNYLSNACQYGGLDGAPLHITVGADAQDSGTICFWVRDSGRGVTPDDQARLFTPFTRLDQTRVRGHGLGLSIVRRIVERLGGMVGVQSEGVPGHGSTFTFTLPAAPIGTPRPVASAEPEPAAPASRDEAVLHGVRMLIVEDEKLFADSVRSLVTAQGMEVLGVAYDGQAAQEMARALQPQIILMDIDLPIVNGLAATRAISAEQPDIKIVMLTASEREGDVFEAFRSGASGYLLKGITAQAFQAQLAGLLLGEVPLSPGLAGRILAEFARSTPSSAAEVVKPLTAQQLDILQRAAQGQTYREVGEALFLSEKTIKYHMGQIVDRLRVKNRSQAVVYYESHLKPRLKRQD
jgi:DNA-binding NarL/FixJ family response regulator